MNTPPLHRLCFPTMLLALFTIGREPAFAAERIVTPNDDLGKVFNDARPGDRFVLADGIWTDAKLKIKAVGSESSPIHLAAQTPGKVVLTGKSRLEISGRYVVVEGLWFRDVNAGGDIISFRTSSRDHAHHCRVTQCAITDSRTSANVEDCKWVSLYGTQNRFDHCFLAGKKSGGTTLVVWVSDQPNGHRIDSNHFGLRPPLGRNGGETIRVGTSDVSLNVSKTTVEGNYFERCNGEAEIISSKSCENVYHRNTFVECSGALTLRHGDRCLVDANYFLGNGAKGSGGVRIIGRDHVVVNNYFENLRGSGSRSALSIMNGIPESPLHGYWQVERAVVAFNTFIECAYPVSVGVGASRKQSLPPKQCTVSNNVFIGSAKPLHQEVEPQNWTWSGNQASATASEIGFAKGSDGIWRPQPNSPVVDAAVGDFTQVSVDIDGDVRGEKRNAGCDELPTAKPTSPLTPDQVGPAWLSVEQRSKSTE